MIKKIWSAVGAYRVKHGEDIAIEVRMHPSVLSECKDCDYQEVITAFNMRPSSPTPTTIFNYKLVIDFDFDEGEWRIQNPTI